MSTFKTTITKPQIPAAMWLLDRLAEEGVSADDLLLDKRKLYLPLDKDVVLTAYHLLTYQYRVLWEESREVVPTKPVTADSLASSIVVEARHDLEISGAELEELRGRASERVQKGASATALGRIRAILEKEVDEIGPVLYEELKQGYRDAAERYYERFMKLAQDPERKGSPSSWDRDAAKLREYVSYDQERAMEAGRPAHWHLTWETARELPEAFTPNYARAEHNAKIAYEDAREGFIQKNLKKFASILGERQDLEEFGVKMEFQSGVFTGDVVLALSNAEVHGEISLKYVVRTIPRVTPYFQYPLNFTGAVIDGKKYPRPSEKELQKLLREER